jgi:hypothetical protein
MVDLRCSIDVTINGQPEMVCMNQNKDTLTVTSCSARENGLVTCLTKVPAAMKADYTCVIKIKHKPLINYKMCNHASNDPDYQFTWQSSSGVYDDVWTIFGKSSVKELTIGLYVSALLNIVLVLLVLLVLVLCRRRQTKGSGVVGTLPSDCASLSSEKQDVKERLSVNSESWLSVNSETCLIPSKIDVFNI